MLRSTNALKLALNRFLNPLKKESHNLYVNRNAINMR